jgi:hypothetical protein
MQNVPQIVRERLKAEVSSAHPETNLLAAFTERSLSDNERQTVLEHLARCAACREIVALALPEPLATQNAPSPAHITWLSWPAFRWGVVTAGLALVALGALKYQRHTRPQLSAMVARQAGPMAATQTNESAAPTAASRNQEKDLGIVASNAQSPRQQSPSPARVYAPESRDRTGSRQGMSLPAHHQSARQSAAPVPSFLPGLAAKQPAAPPIPASAETVAVEAQSAAVDATETQQVAQGAPAPMLNRNVGAIDKAKPAITTALSQLQVQAAPRWSITSTGGLQRSFDGGKSWQDVEVTATTTSAVAANFESSARKSLASNQANQTLAKAPDQPLIFRAVAANGSDVWAGGSNAALYHSTDAGNRWVRVMPSSSGVLLTGDIMGLDFSSPQIGSVSTSTGEVWNTTDAGQSWQKQ